MPSREPRVIRNLGPRVVQRRRLPLGNKRLALGLPAVVVDVPELIEMGNC